MRRAILIMIAALVLPGNAHADPKTCQDQFLQAPKRLEGARIAEKTDFEKDRPGLGYSVKYVWDRGWFTAFFYDMGRPKISDRDVRHNLDQAIADVRQVTRERGVSVQDFNILSVQSDRTVVNLLAEATRTDGFSEYVAVGKRDECIFKARFTNRSDLKPGRKRFLRLLTDFEGAFK